MSRRRRVSPADPAQRRRRRATRRQLIRLLLLAAMAALLVASVRPRLFAWHKRVKEQSDVYFLPPPKQVVALSLGYKAAVADMLWAHVLVSQGLHTFQRRRFENLTRLYDAINELDPTWRSPYLLADALITFQAETTPYEEIVKTREILERGVQHLPHDAEVWLTLGQFVAFLAPYTYLAEEHPDEAEQWRIDGARMLARAAELAGGDNSWVGWQAVGAAGILSKAGERDAAIRFYRRALAVTDDEEFRQFLRLRLESLAGEQAMDEHLHLQDAFRQRVREELPFVTRRLTALVLGPPPAPARCAGPGHGDEPRCAFSWREWGERQRRLGDEE